MSSGERHNVAQELALKDGHLWETLSDVMVNAYLHNAGLVIKERNQPPVDAVTGKPIYACPRCQDNAYISGKPCLECNPVGLPVEQVHPKPVVEAEVSEWVERDEDDPGNGGFLINKEVPAGFSIHPHTKEDDSPGNAELATAPIHRVLKPGEYHCAECGTAHRDTSRIGKKHLEFKI